MKDVEVVIFNDKSWVRLTEYQKVKKENEELKQSNWELLMKIEKMKNCLNCKYGDMCSEGLHCYAPRELTFIKQMNEKTTCCDKWELAE